MRLMFSHIHFVVPKCFSEELPDIFNCIYIIYCIRQLFQYNIFLNCVKILFSRILNSANLDRLLNYVPIKPEMLLLQASVRRAERLVSV
jgi:hypothetical protein